jgi:hypothetical protein
MLWASFLGEIWNHRLQSTTESATHIMWYIGKENLLKRKETMVPYAGVVTALCDRHPSACSEWMTTSLKEMIAHAYTLSLNRKAKVDKLWPEYVMMRWLILATDLEAWNLLLLCHYAPDEQKIAAQAACDRICRSLDGPAMHDSKGNLVGKTQFDDLRLQMLRLAREFSGMTHDQRKLPFDFIPFSKETRLVQEEQPGFPSTSLLPV